MPREHPTADDPLNAFLASAVERASCPETRAWFQALLDHGERIEIAAPSPRPAQPRPAAPKRQQSRKGK
jgi:hypothetical protein